MWVQRHWWHILFCHSLCPTKIQVQSKAKQSKAKTNLGFADVENIFLSICCHGKKQKTITCASKWEWEREREGRRFRKRYVRERERVKLVEDSHYMGSFSACVLLLQAWQVVLILYTLQRLQLKRFHSDEKLIASLINWSLMPLLETFNVPISDHFEAL